MANLTLVIDDQVLQAARIKALQEGTSVNDPSRGDRVVRWRSHGWCRASGQVQGDCSPDRPASGRRLRLAGPRSVLRRGFERAHAGWRACQHRRAEAQGLAPQAAMTRAFFDTNVVVYAVQPTPDLRKDGPKGC
jgi:hypothetical protein